MDEKEKRMKASKYNVFFEDWEKTVCVNFLSKAMARVDSDKYGKIAEILRNPNDYRGGEYEKLRNDLIFGGYLVDEDFDEIQHLKMMNFKERFDTSSVAFTIMPAMECNFDCVYCYETKKGPFMDEKTALKIAQTVAGTASGKKNVHVSWFGGEPLLKFDTIKFVNEYVKSSCEREKTRFTSSVSTNGYLLDGEKAGQFDELGITGIQITMDGTPDYHNKYRPLKGGGPTFDKIHSNVKNLLGATERVTVNLRVNVGPDNYGSVSSLMDMLGDLPKERISIYFRWIFGSDKAADFYSKVREFQGKRPYEKLSGFYFEAVEKGFRVILPILGKNVYCEYDKISSVLVGPEGELHRCTVFNEDPIGNLAQDGPRYDSVKYEKWHKPIAFEDEDCLKCKLLPLCWGGCRLAKMNGGKGCPEEVTDMEGFARLWYGVKESERKRVQPLRVDGITAGGDKR